MTENIVANTSIGTLMKKILVIGAHGNAGHMIYHYLKALGYQVLSLARKNADYNLNIECKKIYSH